MKKIFIPLALAASSLIWPDLVRSGYAQSYLSDTIRVSRLTTTYLIFPSKVSMVDISPEYLVKIESGNIVFVRPRLTNARKTPFFVRTDNGTYLGYLSLSSNNAAAFVEVSKLLESRTKPALISKIASVPTEVTVSKRQNGLITPLAAPADASPYNGPLLASINPFMPFASQIDPRPAIPVAPIKTSKNVLEIQMDSLLSGPATYHDRERNSGIIIKLTHLVHDSTNTYLQLTLANKTAMPFLLDQISFWYQNQAKKRKGAYLDGETYPMEPIFKSMPERVEAGQRIQVKFVLPQFAPQSHSQFVINVREKSGTRNVTMHLPMRKVLYAHRHKLFKGKFFETESILTLLRK